MVFIEDKQFDRANSARKKEQEEKYAIQWAAVMAASGVITLQDSGGNNPAWEHTLHQTPLARADYVKTMQSIIDNDPELKTQALTLYQNTHTREVANKACSKASVSRVQKLILQNAERKKNPPREI